MPTTTADLFRFLPVEIVVQRVDLSSSRVISSSLLFFRLSFRSLSLFFLLSLTLSVGRSLSPPSLFIPSFFYRTLSFAFKFIRTHSTHACVMLDRDAFAWGRVRGDSRSMTFALLRVFVTSLSFFRHYSTHCRYAYFSHGGSGGPEALANRNCTLDMFRRVCDGRMGKRGWFSNFCSSTHSFTRKWNSCNCHVSLLNGSIFVDAAAATFSFDVHQAKVAVKLVPRASPSNPF